MIFYYPIDRPDPIDVVISEVVGVTRLRLTWTAPNDNFAAINKYRVEFRLKNVDNFIAQVFHETTAFLTVEFDRTYFVQVSGCNDAGCGNATEMEVSSPRPSKQLCCCHSGRIITLTSLTAYIIAKHLPESLQRIIILNK